MVREALSGVVAKVVAAAIAQALLAGTPMPAVDEAVGLPKDVDKRVGEYRKCEASFATALTPPPGADAEERALYARRVGVERVVSCLFPRKDAPKVAAGYALDVDFDRASFFDSLLRDLPVPWLAPYLNLAGGHAKLCADRVPDAQRQLAAARRSGDPLIRAAADYLLETNRCVTE